MASKIYKNLVFLRHKKELSQEKICDEIEFKFKVNLSRSTYAAYEQNRNEPCINMLIILCEFHDISIDDLLLSDMKQEEINKWKEKK